MSTSTAYCSACEKDVHLTCTAAPLHEGEANLADGDQLVCLSFGSRCTAGRCPISGLPAVVMGVRLARSGMEPEQPWQIIRMRCDGCEQVTEMEVVDNVYAFCTACSTTNRWFRINLGEEAYLVSVPAPATPGAAPPA